MAKLVLADLASLANQSTAISTINSNSALIEAALEKTLSRDGTSPNTMESDLDVNDNHIINVANPSLSHHAATKEYVDAIVAGDYNIIGPGTTDYLLSWNGTETEWARTIRPETGAVPRTYKSKLNDTVFVEDFGAIADGVTDSRVAIQNALNTGLAVHFSEGQYVVSGTLEVTVSGTQIIGSGTVSTQLYCTNGSSTIFNVTGNDVHISEITLDYSVTPTAGSAIQVNASQFSAQNFSINRAFNGLRLSGTDHSINNFRIYSYVNTGLQAVAIGDLFVDSFVINAVNSTNGANGGINLVNFCEAVVVQNGDILNGVYSMLTSASSYTSGNRPAYNSFTNVYFDTSNSGVYLNGTVDNVFTGCWFSSGRVGAGNPGCTLATTSNNTFVQCRFNNCGSNGAYISANATHSIFIGCEALGNGQTSGSGVSDGFYVEPNTQYFKFINCTSGNLLFIGVQRYGINVAAGTSNYYDIINCTLDSNATGGLLDGGSGTTKNIIGNSGVTESTSASPISVPHIRVRSDSGGVASTISLSGTSNLTSNSTGTGSIKFKGATSRDSSGFIKIYVGTTAYYIPVFSEITG